VQPAGRDVIESAVREVDRKWVGGPFSEQARLLLQQHAEPVRRLLERFDRLIAHVGSDADFVITHGEPHGGNVIVVDGQLVLVDWDTVALAPPERDLWMVSAKSDQEIYAEMSSRRPDPGLIELYRNRWTLEDMAAFVGRFRSAHVRSADDEHAWHSLIRTVTSIA
jgi:spectinomycin phosphotransferase